MRWWARWRSSRAFASAMRSAHALLSGNGPHERPQGTDVIKSTAHELILAKRADGRRRNGHPSRQEIEWPRPVGTDRPAGIAMVLPGFIAVAIPGMKSPAGCRAGYNGRVAISRQRISERS